MLIFDFNNEQIKQLSGLLGECQKKEIQLQHIIGMDLDTLLDIAKAETLFIKVDEVPVAVSYVAKSMREMKCDYNSLRSAFFGSMIKSNPKELKYAPED